MKSADPPPGGSAGSCCVGRRDRLRGDATASARSSRRDCVEPGTSLAGPARPPADRARRGAGGRDRAPADGRAPGRAVQLRPHPRAAHGRRDRRGVRRSRCSSIRACARSTWARGSASPPTRRRRASRTATRAGSSGGTGWDDGETYPAMADRVVAAISAIASRYAANDRVVIVTHGGPDPRGGRACRRAGGRRPPPPGRGPERVAHDDRRAGRRLAARRLQRLGAHRDDQRARAPTPRASLPDPSAVSRRRRGRPAASAGRRGHRSGSSSAATRRSAAARGCAR